MSEKLFMKLDLKRQLVIDRKFDLVVSLEVAEHLPYRSGRFNILLSSGSRSKRHMAY